MRLRHRLLSGVLLLFTLVSSQPTVAQLIEQKTGDMSRSTLLTLYLSSERRPHEDERNQGSFFFSCKEGHDDIHMTLSMGNYRIKNSNRDPCHYASVSLQFDGLPPLFDIWERPPGENIYATFVTSPAQQGPSCPRPSAIPPAWLVSQAISAKYLRAIISDVDITKLGPNEITESPLLRFNLEPVRSDLIEFQNRCGKKK